MEQMATELPVQSESATLSLWSFTCAVNSVKLKRMCNKDDKRKRSFLYNVDGFDVIVSDCYAHNGANKKIQLIDNNGCPLNEKLISRFRGSWTDAGLYETQVFAYMKAFRFTGSPALYIECDVRMCHGHCPVYTETILFVILTL